MKLLAALRKQTRKAHFQAESKNGTAGEPGVDEDDFEGAPGSQNTEGALLHTDGGGDVRGRTHTRQHAREPNHRPLRAKVCAAERLRSPTPSPPGRRPRHRNPYARRRRSRARRYAEWRLHRRSQRLLAAKASARPLRRAAQVAHASRNHSPVPEPLPRRTTLLPPTRACEAE